MSSLAVIDAGVAPYRGALALQKEILARKKRGITRDYLILVEHPNIFTIGRSGSEENILVDKSFLKENCLEVLRVDRGGDITFHGPGQVVAYPIFDLRNHAKDVRSFVCNLKDAAARVITGYGVDVYRNNKYTGVWTSAGKIGFIGIGISSWITYHGVSINANIDLKYFSMIRPCGIKDVSVTSLADILGARINIEDLKESIIKEICEVFSFGRRYCKENAFMALEAHTGFRSW